jgi:hypothetical protein
MRVGSLANFLDASANTPRVRELGDPQPRIACTNALCSDANSATAAERASKACLLGLGRQALSFRILPVPGDPFCGPLVGLAFQGRLQFQPWLETQRLEDGVHHLR